jgi:hypothetical protein
MAECLTDKTIPINAFQQIGVKNEIIRKAVLEMLKDVIDPPFVNICEYWF